MGLHLRTHLGAITGRAFMEKAASSAPEDGDHAVQPRLPWKLLCVPGPCWASLDNAIPSVLHMDRAGAHGPQRPGSPGCRGGASQLRGTNQWKSHPWRQEGPALCQLECNGSMQGHCFTPLFHREMILRNKQAFMQHPGTRGWAGQGPCCGQDRVPTRVPRVCCWPCLLHCSASSHQHHP